MYSRVVMEIMPRKLYNSQRHQLTCTCSLGANRRARLSTAGKEASTRPHSTRLNLSCSWALLLPLEPVSSSNSRLHTMWVSASMATLELTA